MLKNSFPMLLLIVANVAYHVSMKATPARVNAMASLAVCYATALIVALALLPFFGEAREGLAAFRQVGWQSVTLGLGVLGIEVGFMLAYRAGWPISLTPIYANALLTLVLIPIGVWALGEKFSMQNGIGVVLTIAGLFLMGTK